MLKSERHRLILEAIAQQHKVVSAEISHQLHTSDDTIRRDLTELAQAGLLIKVHGGALPLPAPPDQREQQALALLRQGIQLLTGRTDVQSVQLLVINLPL